jgi:hypothetical protein
MRMSTYPSQRHKQVYRKHFPSPSEMVTQGEQVEITLTSDQSAELHLHGYDVTVQLEPGAPAILSFIARIAGRFPVEAHGMGPLAKGRRSPGALFYVEAYPR